MIDDAREVPVTRIEVLDFVGEAFDGTAVDRATLLAAAEADGARPALLALLRRLPAGVLTGPEELWSVLDVPVDLGAARGLGALVNT